VFQVQNQSSSQNSQEISSVTLSNSELATAQDIHCFLNSKQGFQLLRRTEQLKMSQVAQLLHVGTRVSVLQHLLRLGATFNTIDELCGAIKLATSLQQRKRRQQHQDESNIQSPLGFPIDSDFKNPSSTSRYSPLSNCSGAGISTNFISTNKPWPGPNPNHQDEYSGGGVRSQIHSNSRYIIHNPSIQVDSSEYSSSQ
jgi:hypothetical protein